MAPVWCGSPRLLQVRVITRSYEIISLRQATEWVISKVLPEHIDCSRDLREDLERLGAVAAAVPAVPG